MISEQNAKVNTVPPACLPAASARRAICARRSRRRSQPLQAKPESARLAPRCTPRTRYCEALRIPPPRLEEARHSPDANTYSLLIVALLERGGPLTLDEAARRFEEAGVAPARRALASLKRCKPGRPPIYREGDLYALDPHDDDTDLWAFRLGLRPAKATQLRVVRPDPGPLPTPDAPLTAQALEEAWQGGVPADWSAQRVAICVLDAHGKPMRPDEVLAFVRERARSSRLAADSARYWRTGAAIRVHGDGRWALDRAHAAVRSAREAIRAVSPWCAARPTAAPTRQCWRRTADTSNADAGPTRRASPGCGAPCSTRFPRSSPRRSCSSMWIGARSRPFSETRSPRPGSGSPPTRSSRP